MRRIGIDARPLIKKQLTGIGVYVFQIVSYLNKTDNENEYFLYTHLPFETDYHLNSNFHIVVIQGNWKIGTFQMMSSLPKRFKEDKLDVFWGTEQMLPRKTQGVRYVLTIHDMALFINPKWGSRVNTFIQRTFTPTAIKNADTILTVSNSTKKDVERITGKDSECVIRTYVAGEKQKPTKGINEEYFLFVGTIEPRKNIEGVVAAFNEYARDVANVKLVIAGGLGWRYDPILEHIKNSPYKDRITLTGFINQEEKANLYASAKAVLFPSHYEGFGLPTLEAMSVGTIVITANNSSLPEVGGDVALYVDDENDYKSIARLMHRVDEMSETEKLDYKQRAMAHFEEFSWDKCAEETKRILFK